MLDELVPDRAPVLPMQTPGVQMSGRGECRTGKVRHGSEKAARMIARRHTYRDRTQVYKCVHCKYWHLGRQWTHSAKKIEATCSKHHD
jgi:hypothetical protein